MTETRLRDWHGGLAKDCPVGSCRSRVLEPHKLQVSRERETVDNLFDRHLSVKHDMILIHVSTQKLGKTKAVLSGRSGEYDKLHRASN